MGEKKCSRCSQVKSIKYFHKNKTRPDGYAHWCKVCLNSNSKEIYERRKSTESYKNMKRRSNAKSKKLYPEKEKARILARRIPIREACEECGSGGKLHRHHPDYAKPLEVVTLCVGCHENIHHGVIV